MKLIPAFQTTVGTLKSAADVAISLSKLHTMAEVQAKAIELQQIILSAQSSALEAQSEQFTLLDRIRDLEKVLAEVKAWETEKNKYQLEAIVNGRGRENVYAYSTKEGIEPAHKICAACYEDGHKSILQLEYRTPGMDNVLVCHRCKADIYLSGAWRPEHSGRKTARK